MGNTATKGASASEGTVPLVYNSGCKYEKIHAFLCRNLPLQPEQCVDPKEPVDDEELMRVLKPAKLAVRGTIIAGELAMEHGYAINLGGGMHHASSEEGGGWCIYSDIFLSFKNLRRTHPTMRMLIVDLDVHQGNGLARDKQTFYPDDVYIIDAFNPKIYPGDFSTWQSINERIAVTSATVESDYLDAVRAAIPRGIAAFKPDIIFYNAGTDILTNDPLNGGVSISEAGIVARDEAVFQAARDAKVPIVMVLSGGYARDNAAVVGNSILNLARKFGLFAPRVGNDTPGTQAT